MKFKKISFSQFLNELVLALLQQKPPKDYYWKTYDSETDKEIYKLITEVDLLRDRFKTEDDDFNYYEYELKDPQIYEKINESL